MSGVDKINRTEEQEALSERGPLWLYVQYFTPPRPARSTAWKIAFPSKPSLTASRYISQNDDVAISVHSRVTGWRRTRDTERYWSAVKRDVNCRERRKTPEGEAPRESRGTPASVSASLYRRNRRVNGRVNKYSRNCLRRMEDPTPGWFLRVRHNAALLFH